MSPLCRKMNGESSWTRRVSRASDTKRRSLATSTPQMGLQWKDKGKSESLLATTVVVDTVDLGYSSLKYSVLLDITFILSS